MRFAAAHMASIQPAWMASALHISAPRQTFHEDRDRAKEFVIKGQPLHDRLDAGRHDVEREHLAAEEIFEASKR